MLVDESCRELKPGEKYSAPGDELYRAGRRLVEDSAGLEIADDVKELVEEVDDLAASGMLAPEKGRVRPTPSGKSIYGVWETITGLGEYFNDIGLTLYSGVNELNRRKVIDICLGEAQNISPPGGPDVVIFMKNIVELTSDTIQSRMTTGSAGLTTDWTTYEKIYYQLEPKLERGHDMWSRLKNGKSARIEEVAWTRMLGECGEDKDGFAKKYAKAYIADTHLHEVYHARISGRGNYRGAAEEAAAQLYAMSRGDNPLGALIDLYLWTGNFPAKEYIKASKLAFKYLKKAGYHKSSWKKSGPDDTGLDAVLLTLREQAENALTMLERDNKMRDHNKLERELGLSRNYAKLNHELERIILATK